MASLGEAYLAIVPKLDDSAMSSSVSSIKSGLSTAAKAGVAAFAAIGTAAVAGAVSITKSAVESYAAYEQNVGGMQKLYGDAYQTMVDQAQNAYKTCGLSANDYMEQASSFSAALTSSLGGDVVKAAEQAQVAMSAMSDNVNTFGTDMTDVQNAFQGFAKQNYTMLDNLKLGYGGTKSEMERLISDANEYAASIGQASDLSIDSFSDIVTAIELVQEKQGIAGTTAKEASTTVEGSINQMKAAWENWLTVLGTGDFDTVMSATQNLTESIQTALGNVLPVVETVFQSISEALPTLMAELEPILSEIVNTWGPPLAEAAANALGAVFSALMANMPGLLTILGSLLNALIDELILFPLMELGSTIGAAISTWWSGVVAQAASFASQFVSTVTGFFSQLPGQIASFLTSAVSSIASFAAQCLTNAQQAGSQFLSGIQSGFNSAVSFVAGIPSRILSALGNVGSLLYNAGCSIINGLKNGIVNAVQGVYDFVSGIAGKIASLKGPISYDRVVLTPNGEALMESLLTGIKGGVQPVYDYVGGIADDLSERMSVSSNLALAGAATSSVTSTVSTSGSLLDRLDTIASRLEGHETAVYVDGKKLASTIAKPMNQQLGVLARRGA